MKDCLMSVANDVYVCRAVVVGIDDNPKTSEAQDSRHSVIISNQSAWVYNLLQMLPAILR